MKLTRSEFLSSVAAAAVSAAVAPGAVAATAKVAPVDTADGFAQHLQSSFWVDRTPGWSQELVLTAVMRRPSAPGSEQFTLLFVTPDGSVPEGTWRVEHRALGELRLFLVPAGETRSGKLFRADFNLRRDAAPLRRPTR